jgi:hypothetical protein
VPHQDALTIVAKLDPQRMAALQASMDVLRQDPARNDILPFGALPGCHFGRVVVLPATRDLHGHEIAPQLLMLSDCDGSADGHLEALVDTVGAGLDRLFGHCKGYPENLGNGTGRSARLAFLRDRQVRTKANYVHRPGRTVDQIRGEAKLYRSLQGYLGEQRLRGIGPLEARKQLRRHVEHTPELSWALSAPPSIGLGYRARSALHATTLPLALTLLGPITIPAALVLVLLVRLQELRDASEDERPTPEHVRELAQLEDFFAHNGFTAGGFVKPGLVRRAVVETVLPLIGYGTRHLFTRDSLAGVKTIHFARWIPLDGGRRVVFCSNYDGSLESYNNDFIDLVAWGLNLVFSNGQGYPRTRFLVLEGAEREQEFKDFLRRHQIPTPVWYSAYPELTAVNVVRNAKLRAGLRGFMTERQARQWLRLL